MRCVCVSSNVSYSVLSLSRTLLMHAIVHTHTHIHLMMMHTALHSHQFESVEWACSIFRWCCLSYSVSPLNGTILKMNASYNQVFTWQWEKLMAHSWAWTPFFDRNSTKLINFYLDRKRNRFMLQAKIAKYSITSRASFSVFWQIVFLLCIQDSWAILCPAFSLHTPKMFWLLSFCLWFILRS